MPSVTRLHLPRASLHLKLNLTKTRPHPAVNYRFSSTWEGRQASEHVTNSKDDYNVQSSASLSGKKARASESEQSSAASEKDHGNQNEKAKKDHPEAPGPVIGTNDERGGVSCLIFLFGIIVDSDVERTFCMKGKVTAGSRGRL